MTMTIDEAVVSTAQQNETWDWRTEDLAREVLGITTSTGAAQHQVQLATHRARLADPTDGANQVFVMSRGPRFVAILERS